jgi:competence protein ComEC
VIQQQALSLLLGVLAAIAVTFDIDGITSRALAVPPLAWCAHHGWPLAIGLTLLSIASVWRWQQLRWLPGLLAGLWLAGWQLQHYQSLRWPEHSTERALVNARIASIPFRQGAETSVVADLSSVEAALERAGTPRVVTRHAQLRWHGAPPLHVGERWRLLVSLRAPASSANPGRGSDALLNLRERIHARASVVESRQNQRLSAAPASIDGVREHLATGLLARISERDTAALAVALAVGETQYVSQQQWRVFNATGITHLVAISGLHVTLFSVLMSAMARGLWRSLPPLRRWRRESFAALLGVSAAGGYALLSGFSVPAERTLLMLATWHLLRGAARPARTAPALAIALLLVLLWDPLAPLGAGFWLSFVAVAVLLHATGDVAASTFNWRAVWHTQWHVAAGLVPVTLAVFGSVSLAGLVVNMLAIPLFSLLLVPLVLAASATLLVCPPLTDGLLTLLSFIHEYTWPWLVRAADSPLALLRMDPAWWWYGLSVPAVALALLPWRWPLRASALLALVPALFPASEALREGQYRMLVLDVGRGLAVIVQTAGHALLFDNGESWGTAGARSRGTVLPALRSLHVRQLDRVLVPRVDADRAAGLVALAAELPVRSLQAGSRPLPPEFTACQRGDAWTWEQVRFQSLGEPDCALRIVAADGGAALLPGDLDPAAQKLLLADGLSASAVVIVPRHGSGAGYLASLRDASAAGIAIVSNSSTGADTAAVRATMAAWRASGAEVLLTADTGAIEIIAGTGELRVRTERVNR